MTEQELQAYIQAITPADRAAMDAAEKRQAALAKPPGSLGELETISIRLAGITGQVCPAMDKCRVAVFAADNGVVDEGVSCAPVRDAAAGGEHDPARDGNVVTGRVLRRPGGGGGRGYGAEPAL